MDGFPSYCRTRTDFNGCVEIIIYLMDYDGRVMMGEGYGTSVKCVECLGSLGKQKRVVL